MERYFLIAGSRVRVTGADEELFTDPGILAEFETDGPEFHRSIHCAFVQELPPPEGELLFHDPGRRVYALGGGIVTWIGPEEAPYIRMVRRGREVTAQMKRSAFPDRITAKSVLTALEAEHIVADNDGFLLHASCVCHRGRAIAFTAPSGTGKSTQAALWEQHRGAQIINGDRIMLRADHALGIPFCGSSGICRNTQLPLRAIVYLSQGAQNTVTRLSGLGAFRKIWEGCSLHTWDRREVERSMSAVLRTMELVPVYHLSCTPDEAAIEALEAILNETEV